MNVAINSMWVLPVSSAVQEVPPRGYCGAGEEDGDGCEVHERKCARLISHSHQFKHPMSLSFTRI